MTVETYSYSEEEKDQQIYQMLRAWAPDSFPQGCLLPKLGVIVYDDLGSAVCYMCADMSNSVPRAFLDHLQTNPDMPALTRFKAVKLAEKFLCQELRRLGYYQVSAITLKAGIASISQSLGYKVYDRAVVHLQKAI